MRTSFQKVHWRWLQADFPFEPFLFHHSQKRKAGAEMNKIVYLGLLVLFLPAMVFAQEKIDAPAWNVGDKWTFTGNGTIEVIKGDQSGYMLEFSERNCVVETQGCNAILFEKSNRNRIYAVEGDKRKKYVMGLAKVFDFPLMLGKKWKYAYSAKAIMGGAYHPVSNDYSENYTVVGWEDLQVQAGRFKALKLEYKRITTGSSSSWGGTGEESNYLYWYSPEVKYLVKCQYDKDILKGSKDIFNWELISFQLKK